MQPAEGPAGIEPQQHFPHHGGHTTQEVHKYRNNVPREHRQPERQQHSSFPEPDTANLRIDTTEDPTEMKKAYPPPQTPLLHSALRNTGLPYHRAGCMGKRSSPGKG